MSDGIRCWFDAWPVAEPHQFQPSDSDLLACFLRAGETERKLLDGELTLAIAHAPAESDQIEIDPLMDDPLAFIVGEHHPWPGLPALPSATCKTMG